MNKPSATVSVLIWFDFPRALEIIYHPFHNEAHTALGFYDRTLFCLLRLFCLCFLYWPLNIWALLDSALSPLSFLNSLSLWDTCFLGLNYPIDADNSQIYTTSQDVSLGLQTWICNFLLDLHLNVSQLS